MRIPELDIDTTPRYRIRDTRTGQDLTKQYHTRGAAQRRADALDTEYGAVRYVVFPAKS